MFYPPLLSTLHWLSISLRKSSQRSIEFSTISPLLSLWFHTILLPAVVILLHLQPLSSLLLQLVGHTLVKALDFRAFHMLLTCAWDALRWVTWLIPSSFLGLCQISHSWWGFPWPLYSKLDITATAKYPPFSTFIFSTWLITI